MQHTMEFEELEEETTAFWNRLLYPESTTLTLFQVHGLAIEDICEADYCSTFEVVAERVWQAMALTDVTRERQISFVNLLWKPFAVVFIKCDLAHRRWDLPYEDFINLQVETLCDIMKMTIDEAAAQGITGVL